MLNLYFTDKPFRSIVKILLVFSLLTGSYGCVKSKVFEEPDSTCENVLMANATFADIKSLYRDKTIQIQEDFTIEGYIISSDQENNFFGVLHFQDAAENPTDGFQLEIDLRNSYLFYDIGDKILLNVKGLYLGKSKGVFKLGGVFSSFGNEIVGRLPSASVFEKVKVRCGESRNIVPTVTTILDLKESLVNTLITLEDVEFSEDELGLLFAGEREETVRKLVNCIDEELVLRTSGFAEFQSKFLPEGRGGITGILTQDGDEYQLIVRKLNDINFEEERCDDLITEFTSSNIFFSELADPNNNAGARFVEIYNSGDTALPLKGWTLLRYTNASAEVSSSLDLSGLEIDSESTLVISPNAIEFESVYGFAPDIGISTNSPADSNGDDNLQLVDPFGTVIDVFGVVGEDGSGTNHEFEDGRALRNLFIVKGNSTYTISEWEISNDTGGAGTTNNPKNAPEDFSPGIRF